MSEIRVDKLINEAGTGAVELVEGAIIPSGKQISGSGNLNLSGIITTSTLYVTGNTTIDGNLTVNGTETVINTQILDIEDKTVGIASTSLASNVTAEGAGIVIYGGSDGDKSLTYNDTKKGFEFNIPLSTNENRFITISEKSTIIDGNTVSLTYGGSSSNVAICTNPSGDVTLNVTGIPTTTDFNNHILTFSVIINSTGTARTCTAVNLNGLSKTIRWTGGSLSNAISGVTTESGYIVQSFTGINTVGSASTTANYEVFGIVSGGFY